jgi:hypothetical protein
MQTKNQIYEIISELKKVIPSFYSVPVGNDEEREMMDEQGIIGAIVIQDGPFKDTTIILREIRQVGENLQIDYVAVDIDKKVLADNPEMQTIVGNMVNYFLAIERLKDFEETPVDNTDPE